MHKLTWQVIVLYLALIFIRFRCSACYSFTPCSKTRLFKLLKFVYLEKDIFE